MIRKGVFSNYDPEILALSIIKQIRAKYSLVAWDSNLEEMTGYCSEDI